jgi:hypothetical protein
MFFSPPRYRRFSRRHPTKKFFEKFKSLDNFCAPNTPSFAGTASCLGSSAGDVFIAHRGHSRVLPQHESFFTGLSQAHDSSRQHAGMIHTAEAKKDTTIIPAEIFLIFSDSQKAP